MIVANKSENISMTLQLIKSDGISVESSAVISYKIYDSIGSTELVPSQVTTYNSTTKSYTDTLVPSASWTTQEVGTYLVVWSVSGTTDVFNDTYTEVLQINIDKNLIDRILSLVHENIYIDNPSYDVNSNLVSARVRIYSDGASVGTTSNVIGTYQITADTTGQGPGKFNKWKQIKV